MKSLILATMVAAASLTTLSATSVPSKAASLTITTDDGSMRHDDRYWRHHNRDREHWRHWRHDRKCRVKVERRWRNHHWVVREVKICRSYNDW